MVKSGFAGPGRKNFDSREIVRLALKTLSRRKVKGNPFRQALDEMQQTMGSPGIVEIKAAEVMYRRSSGRSRLLCHEGRCVISSTKYCGCLPLEYKVAS